MASAAHQDIGPASSRAQAELGPALRPRVAVHVQAVELLALARLAVEFSTSGPMRDLRRAELQIERMRAELGGVHA